MSPTEANAPESKAEIAAVATEVSNDAKGETDTKNVGAKGAEQQDAKFIGM